MPRDNARILITDDDAAIRALLILVCVRAGFSAECARDGEEALAKMRASRYDVLLLDLMMPEVNGYEVISVLRELVVRPAVIVLTAQGEDQTKGIADGTVVHALIHNPFDLVALSAILVETARWMGVQRE